LALFKSLMEEPEFRDHDDVGLVIQAYLREAERDLDDLLAWAQRRRGRVTVRLVKGAYWDYETVLARQRGWPVPVFLHKAETDANLERLTVTLLRHERHVRLALGTHNVRSIAHALVQARRLGVDPRSFELQMLHGMAEPIKAALVRLGLRVREYAPVGELLPGMGYLVRRLLENTSNEGFLRAKFAAHQAAETLLRDPAEGVLSLSRETKAASSPRREFQNEPWADFTQPANRAALREGLELVRQQLGRTYPLVIGKKEVPTADHTVSLNPACPNQVVGRVARATLADAAAAVEAARGAWSAWRRTSTETRAGVLEKAAEIMRARRFELAAWEVFEVGKPWREADADVTEAIDFCRFYAQAMRRLDRPTRTAHVPGESCHAEYRPRGVGVVIAPWNFPLAILCGMTSAALVTGNTVVMKPAEPSAVIGYRLMEIFREAGLPAGVLNYLPGRGADIGAALVEHPAVAFIAFTGSKEVGLKIFESAGRTGPGQAHLKHVVCEMGGKNAIIVDRDADLDEAVPGALQSAFGYAGQKCSALSRLIVLEPVYERTLARL
ncbi:MAG: proline dehydrogenase family protein, partial [Verrucomicrobia bacterium]|nr:proline dehydrogenase family protein [Verrucomicrobiota bacterium]